MNNKRRLTFKERVIDFFDHSFAVTPFFVAIFITEMCKAHFAPHNADAGLDVLLAPFFAVCWGTLHGLGYLLMEVSGINNMFRVADEDRFKRDREFYAAHAENT